MVRFRALVAVVLLFPVAGAACGGDSRVPNVVGKTLDEARTTLESAGLDVETEGGGAFGVVVESAWEVCRQEPEAGQTAGSVTVFVERDCDGGGDSDEPIDDGEQATSAGLTATPAQAACDARGESEFPYGFDGHWVLGKLAERLEGDRWFFKVEATVTNEFNAERRINVECFVGGTKDAPVVEKFNAY